MNFIEKTLKHYCYTFFPYYIINKLRFFEFSLTEYFPFHLHDNVGKKQCSVSNDQKEGLEYYYQSLMTYSERFCINPLRVDNEILSYH